MAVSDFYSLNLLLSAFFSFSFFSFLFFLWRVQTLQSCKVIKFVVLTQVVNK